MKRVPSIVVLALLLAGCGSDDSDGMKPISDRVVRLEAEVKAIREEMSAMRPAIERLVQVESDIRQVVEDLKVLAEAPAPASAPPQPIAAAPAAPARATPTPGPAPMPAAAPPPAQSGPAAEKPPAEPPSPAPVRSDVPVAAAPSLPAPQPAAAQQPAVLPAAATGLPTGGLAVHLASYGSRETAARGWRELQARYPALLGGLSAVLAPIQTDRGTTLLRLKAGPVATDGDVARLCQTIRQRGDFCSPETFDGTPLAALREVSGRSGATQRAAVPPAEQVAGR